MALTKRVPGTWCSRPPHRPPGLDGPRPRRPERKRQAFLHRLPSPRASRCPSAPPNSVKGSTWGCVWGRPPLRPAWSSGNKQATTGNMNLGRREPPAGGPAEWLRGKEPETPGHRLPQLHGSSPLPPPTGGPGSDGPSGAGSLVPIVAGTSSAAPRSPRSTSRCASRHERLKSAEARSHPGRQVHTGLAGSAAIIFVTRSRACKPSF